MIVEGFDEPCGEGEGASGCGGLWLAEVQLPAYLGEGVVDADRAAEAGQAVVVEGYTDTIAAHQAGIANAVATGGTALTAQHIEALRPVASTLTLAFDGDTAGFHAAQRVAELPKHVITGLHLQVARLPAGSDPASLLAAQETNLLRTAIGRPTPLVHYLIDHLVMQYNLGEPEALVRALRAAGPLVDQLTDSSSRALAVGHLAERVGRSQEMIATALKSYSRTPERHRDRSASRSLR